MSPITRTGIAIGLLSLIAGTVIVLWRNSSSSSPVLSTQQRMSQAVTNQWYSSLYFSDWSSPMFAFPLAYQLSADGMAVSYPAITGSEKTVFGSFVPQLRVGIPGKLVSKKVLKADPASVTVELCGVDYCFTTVMAHGVPVTHYTMSADGVLELRESQAVEAQIEDLQLRLAFPTSRYVAGVYRNGSWVPLALKQDGSLITLTLKAGDRLSIGLEPDSGSLTLEQMAAAVIETSVDFSNHENDLATSLAYVTDTGKPALVALLPHHWKSVQENELGTYQTVRGTMKLYSTKSIVQRLQQHEVLSIAGMVQTLTPPQKTELSKHVSASAVGILAEAPHQTIYDAGKQVFRLAQVFEIAGALDHPETDALQRKLVTILQDWLGKAPSDTHPHLKLVENPRGVVAVVPQFGNEVFNDHHFHYGYFVAAAGILIDAAPEFQVSLEPGVTALLTDIGNLDTTNGYPFLRGFDVYESHSWADGHATTGDGNNQESTSEAINRWYGFLRLAQATGDDRLLQVARHGLAMEQEAAQLYWLGQKPALYQFPKGFEHPMASLVWGGKVDYATWFSNHASHIYGIQFLPMTPAMTHVRSLETWKKYNEYLETADPVDWDDIRWMVAAANDELVPTEMPQYEGGNSAAWYYLWTQYWMNR